MESTRCLWLVRTKPCFTFLPRWNSLVGLISVTRMTASIRDKTLVTARKIAKRPWFSLPLFSRFQWPQLRQPLEGVEDFPLLQRKAAPQKQSLGESLYFTVWCVWQTHSRREVLSASWRRIALAAKNVNRVVLVVCGNLLLTPYWEFRPCELWLWNSMSTNICQKSPEPPSIFTHWRKGLFFCERVREGKTSPNSATIFLQGRSTRYQQTISILIRFNEPKWGLRKQKMSASEGIIMLCINKLLLF